MPSPLIAADELAALPPDVVRIVDARWKLGASEAGREMFQAGHIPGAVHLDMDRDLAAAPGTGGRHPLPSAAAFAESASRAGIGVGTKVVAYDGGDGTGATRLWWLLRHFGHDDARVLDGGFPAWLAAGLPVEEGPGTPAPRREFEAHVRSDDTVTADEVRQGGVHLLDARAPERWRGDVEPIDPRPGRIPGAMNAPSADNLRAGRFREPSELRDYYERLGVLDGKPIVASCGSGVSACVDLFALQLAGVAGARLYPGSYSEWLALGLPTETS